MRQGSTKIGRNDSCSCGNGKKFKRCHGAAATYPVTYPATQEMVERGRLQLAQHQAREKQREQQQGFGKPIISLEMKGTRFVAVGKTLRYSTKWKTVHDFLGDYIRAVLGTDWGNTELAKPFEQRHPILIWYHHLCLLQQTFITELGNVHSAPMTGAASAWFQLAYDLYSLEHNAELQQKLLGRIKNPDMFSGARYETFVAGVMIRAGFDIEFENEDDRGTTHVEFTATCRKSGRKYSVEAKQRNAGINLDNASRRFRLGKLLQKALKKIAKHPRIVFIGIDVPDTASDEAIPSYLTHALADLRKFEGRYLNGHTLPPAYLIVTNQPYEHSLEGTKIRCAVMAEGFQIPDFKMDKEFTSLRAAHHARKAHADMYQLLDSIRQHTEAPVTFDGQAPELAFSEQPHKLVIGETYLVPDSRGIERPGKLTTATVSEEQSLVYVSHYLDNGEAIVGTVPLTNAELAAYKRHPETFFGVEMKATRTIQTPLELFDFFMYGYRDTPKERLLELMAHSPDVVELSGLQKEDLIEIYAERCVFAALQQSAKDESV